MTSIDQLFLIWSKIMQIQIIQINSSQLLGIKIGIRVTRGQVAYLNLVIAGIKKALLKLSTVTML
jgi:hypothetical protein